MKKRQAGHDNNCITTEQALIEYPFCHFKGILRNNDTTLFESKAQWFYLKNWLKVIDGCCNASSTSFSSRGSQHFSLG